MSNFWHFPCQSQKFQEILKASFFKFASLYFWKLKIVTRLWVITHSCDYFEVFENSHNWGLFRTSQISALSHAIIGTRVSWCSMNIFLYIMAPRHIQKYLHETSTIHGFSIITWLIVLIKYPQRQLWLFWASRIPTIVTFVHNTESYVMKKIGNSVLFYIYSSSTSHLWKSMHSIKKALMCFDKILKFILTNLPRARKRENGYIIISELRFFRISAPRKPLQMK